MYHNNKNHKVYQNVSSFNFPSKFLLDWERKESTFPTFCNSSYNIVKDKNQPLCFHSLIPCELFVL